MCGPGHHLKPNPLQAASQGHPGVGIGALALRAVTFVTAADNAACAAGRAARATGDSRADTH